MIIYMYHDTCKTNENCQIKACPLFQVELCVANKRKTYFNACIQLCSVVTMVSKVNSSFECFNAFEGLEASNLCPNTNATVIVNANE